MKDSVKIGLGVFGGIVAAFACIACFFLVTGVGGLAAIGSLLGAPPAAPIPTAASYAATPTQLAKGHILECDDIGLTIVSYETAIVCPSGAGGPAEGAQFVVVWLSATNATSDVLELPQIEFSLNGYQAGLGSSGECLYNAESFGNSCFDTQGKFFPDVTCQGWELFEVPGGFDAHSATLYASFADATTRVSCEAQWPLVPLSWRRPHRRPTSSPMLSQPATS
jgi:hypothetical protein